MGQPLQASQANARGAVQVLHATIARHRSSSFWRYRRQAREIDDGGNQRKSRAATAITSRLSPLSDNNIRAAIEGFSRLREVLHLHDQARRGASSLVAERPDAAEGQEDGGRLPALSSRVSHVWSPYSPPMKPSPPAWVTAAANAPPLMPAIGIDRTGSWMPSSAVPAV